MANEIYIEGSYFNANFSATGWSDFIDRNGEKILLVTAVIGDSVTILNVTDAENIFLLDQIQDNVVLNGTEFVDVIGNYAYISSLYSNSIHTVDITDLEDISIAQTFTDGPGENDYLTGVAGCVIVDNIGGYDRVMFCCAYQGQCVTSVDISDPLNFSIIDSLKDATYLDAVVTCTYKDGYLFCAVRGNDCMTVLDVSDPANITHVTSLFDPVLLRLNDIGALDTIDGDYLYVPGGTANTFSVIDISDPTAPFITGFITDPALLDRPLVAAIVRSDISFHYIALTCYDDDRLVLINVTDPSNPVVAQNITDPLLNGADDVKWDPDTKRAYVSCGVSKRIVIVKIPLLETLMATIKKTWAAAVELHQTAAYGGTDAVLAADQKYDYTADVDLTTAGNQGAQVDLSFRGSDAKDDLIVDVFASNDGSAFDSVPSQHYELKCDGKPQQFSFLVLEFSHFRIGVRSSGTNTSFEYQVNQRIWILTNV